VVDTLSVWTFGAPRTAEDILPRLCENNGVLGVTDAALVTWPAGRRKPALRTLGALNGPGSLWDGFWGVLFALIFLTPLAGPAFGAAAGAVAGSLADFGVEDDFIMRVRDTVTTGTSAVFVIGGPHTPDRIAAALADHTVATIRTDLSHEQTQQLHDALGAE
jgi:uncharacterized membrane protein